MEDFEDRKKLNKKELRKVVEGSKEEFADLTIRLGRLVAEFCVRALKSCQASTNEPLNVLEINRISTGEIAAVIGQLQDPRLARAQHHFYHSTDLTGELDELRHIAEQYGAITTQKEATLKLCWSLITPPYRACCQERIA